MSGQILSWDSTFMSVATVISHRSKDPKTKVGAIIVKDHKIISAGYNGFPKTLSEVNNDLIYSWRDGTKNIYVVHAEQNAIFNNTGSNRDCTMFTTLFPCSECAKAIIQSGIIKIIYKSRKEGGSYANSFEMLTNAGVVIEKYDIIGEMLKIEY